MRDNAFVQIRKLAPMLLLAALCLAQGNWQTATDLPGIDWQGLTGAKKQAALNFLREEKCACGCNMKLAECRMGDPACAVSRKLSNIAVKDFAAGRNPNDIRAELKKIAEEPPPVLDDPVKISIAGDPYKGPENARMVMVEFSDFQCPYCQKAVAEANKILAAFPKDVKLVFKQFPLDSHEDAEFGAEAALAAQAQGKFWEMHDRLYGGFPDLSRATVMRYAKQIGLDLNRFTRELDSHKYKDRVHAEEQEGEAAGVGGTPTFYFNGRRYNGAFDLASVAPVIKSQLK
ncbi:MAG TPA: thioredoxin domain-containing protein [Bryobacteraceae bacterium]|nr:thioredoxin domain-containing protein [Bryobacteraceae bacterium]